MDRITLKRKVFLSGFTVVLILFLSLKAVNEGWLLPRTPLPVEVGSEPVLLFFNKYKGCECELVVYQSAEAQIKSWIAEDRSGLPVYTYNLSRRPDLAKRFSIIRAPALLLLDATGNIFHQQNEIIADQVPFDLKSYEEKILILLKNK